MARLKKRKDGYFKKSFTFNGKRVYVYGKTTQELLENEVKKRTELENGLQTSGTPTLNDYYEHFSNRRLTEIKASTIRSQKCQYATLAGVTMAAGLTFGEMHIKDITRRDIETARETMLKEGKTPQNINNIFAHLNHVLNSALLDEIIDKNPCRALKLLKRTTPPINETKHRALTEEETKLFFDTAAEQKSYYLNAFKFMINCGVRVGELGALYRTDIDRKNGFIYIRRTVSRNEAGTYIISENTKTKNGQRDIPLTEELNRIIKDQEAMNGLLFGIKLKGLLFVAAEGAILREYPVNREIKRICKLAGIQPFTCHAFRNTFATRFIEQRPQDYKILSEILGHKDISITLNLYTHVMTENKVKAMQDIQIKTS